jgi:hypothetical protein
MTNRQWLIADRPIGRALRGEDFRWAEGAVPDLKDGDVLVRTLVISFDPGQKGWMENISTYVAPTQIGDVMRASGVGPGGRIPLAAAAARRRGARHALLAGLRRASRARAGAAGGR